MPTNNKFFGFKVFSDIKGQKALDFSFLEYKKEIQDANGNNIPLLNNGQSVTRTTKNGEVVQVFQTELKGFRLKIEGTDDGWKSKKTIYLEGQELSDLVAVILGQQKNMKAQRPDKSCSLENQGTHSFMNLQSKDASGVSKNYYGKISKYDGLRLIGICISVIQAELQRETGVQVNGIQVLDMIKSLYSGTVIPQTVQTPTVPTVKQVSPQTNEEFINENLKFPEDEGYVNPYEVETSTVVPQVTVAQPTQVQHVHTDGKKCECGYDLSSEKSAKVLEFSIKKFGKPVCYNCQQKLKGQ